MQQQETSRRSLRHHAYFEVEVCDISGRRIRGTPYRQRAICGDAYDYQYRRPSDNSDSPLLQWRAEYRRKQIGRTLAKRLATLLDEETIDLLFMIEVEGISQAEIARERGVNRSTIMRQFNHAVEMIRSDRVLRILLACTDEDAC
jgi:DNA-directed RNA polymerase specialized sigma24 family protein